jgi:hypothetical protein
MKMTTKNQNEITGIHHYGFTFKLTSGNAAILWLRHDHDNAPREGERVQMEMEFLRQPSAVDVHEYLEQREKVRRVLYADGVKVRRFIDQADDLLREMQPDTTRPEITIRT